MGEDGDEEGDDKGRREEIFEMHGSEVVEKMRKSDEWMDILGHGRIKLNKNFIHSMPPTIHSSLTW